MDWRQLIIDYPLLSLLLVVPLFVFAAAIKIGVVLATGRKAPPDSEG